MSETHLVHEIKHRTDNILMLAWDENGKLIQAEVCHDEDTATDRAEGWLDMDERIAHLVKYYATFQPTDQPTTHLQSYAWTALEEVES